MLPDENGRCWRDFTRVSTPIVESWRLNLERAQVHIALAAMMNLVVDDIEDEVVDYPGY